MSLKCVNCGSTNTVIIPAEKLETNGIICKSSSGKFSIDDWEKILKLFISLAEFLMKCWEWFRCQKETTSIEKKNSSNVLICKDCQHWERI